MDSKKPRAYKTWTVAETENLIDAIESGLNYNQIAHLMQRTPKAIGVRTSRLKAMGHLAEDVRPVRINKKKRKTPVRTHQRSSNDEYTTYEPPTENTSRLVTIEFIMDPSDEELLRDAVKNALSELKNYGYARVTENKTLIGDGESNCDILDRRADESWR